MKKKLFILILAGGLSFSGCRSSTKKYPVVFVDRSEIFSINKGVKPLVLVVRITGDGGLSLNQIKTGTLSDLRELSEKLEVIFTDREKLGISEREVVIDRQGEVKNEDLERLIECLAEVKAAPIRVIKNEF